MIPDASLWLDAIALLAIGAVFSAGATVAMFRLFDLFFPHPILQEQA